MAHRPEAYSVRLLSYNVRYFGHRLKGVASTPSAKMAIARAIAALEPLPDVVALQEVEARSIRAHAVHRGAHARETQLEAFLRHLEAAFARTGRPMPYVALYFPAHEYRLGTVKFYTTGLAVLTRAETLTVTACNGDRPHRISNQRTPLLLRLKQTRIAAHVQLEDTRGRVFHVFNTHLSLPTPWARDFWRQDDKMGFGKNQVDELEAVLAYVHRVAGDAPHILVGDFNAAPGTPVYRAAVEHGHLTSALERLGLVDGTTPRGFPTAGFLTLRMHLDHVFGSQQVDFRDARGTFPFADARSPFHGLSDHVPLLVEFDVAAPERRTPP